jgi:hypothetical protein
VADLGFRVDLPVGLACGMSVRNVTAAALGASGEPLPQVCAIGIAYHPAQDVLLACDVRKQTGYEPSVCYGFEYRCTGAVALRAGVSDAASAYAAGIGIHVAPLRIDYDATAHQELGWTHEATLSVYWGGRQ